MAKAARWAALRVPGTAQEHIPRNARLQPLLFSLLVEMPAQLWQRQVTLRKQKQNRTLTCFAAGFDNIPVLFTQVLLLAVTKAPEGIDLREAAASSGMKTDLSSLPRNGTWVAWMETRNPSLHTPWLLLPVKNAFLTAAKTVKTGTKFIIRDIAQKVGETVCLVKTEARQRCTPGDKGCGCPP